MAALGTSSAKPKNWDFTTFLAYAVLEWLLNLFLLVTSIFSFLVTKFAYYCKLRTPCLLCSRLHHVFGMGNYWDLICSNHKLENSCLVLCHAHNKLVDVRWMCETCLFSLLEEDARCGFDQDTLLEEHRFGSSSSRHCRCCKAPWVLKGNSQKLVQSKSLGCEVVQLGVKVFWGMAALGTSSAKPQNWGFTTFLASAVLEWLLILCLLVTSIFSFLVTKFAHYFKLQTPCLLCSKLHHIFGLGWYWDLICSSHKLENSCLVLCHAHNKLVDVYGMCETCLFSLLEEDAQCGFDQGTLLEGNKCGSSSTRHCRCCNAPCVLKGNTQKLVQTKSVGCGVAELDVPLSGEVGLNQDDQKKRCTHREGNFDTESEFLHSHDAASVSYCETDVSKTNFAVPGAQSEPLTITPADGSAPYNLIIANSAPKASPSMSQVQLDPIEAYGSKSVALTAAVENGLEELNRQQAYSRAYSPAAAEADRKANSPAVSDVISLDDVTPSSNAMGTTIEVSKECCKGAQSESLIITPANDSAPCKLISASSAHKASPSMVQAQLDPIEAYDSTSVASTAAVENGPEELNHQQANSRACSLAAAEADRKANSSAVYDLISVDDVTPSSNAMETAVEVSKGSCAQPEPLIITPADDPAPYKLIIASSAPKASPSMSQAQIDPIEAYGSTSVASTAVVENGPEELNRQQADSRACSSAAAEAARKANSLAVNDVISLDDVTPSSNAMGTTIEVSKESCAQSEPLIITPANDSTPCNLVISNSAPKVTSSMSQAQLDPIEAYGRTSVARTVAVENCLEELNWQQANSRVCYPVVNHLFSPYVTQSSRPFSTTVAVENDLEELNWQQANSKARCPAPAEAVSKASGPAPAEADSEANSPALDDSKASCPAPAEADSEASSPVQASSPVSAEADSKASSLLENNLVSLDDVTPSSNAMETRIEVSKESCLTRTGEVGQTCVAQSGKIKDAITVPRESSEIGLETEAVSSEAAQRQPNLNLGDSNEIAVDNRGTQLSGSLVGEQEDSPKVDENLKILLSRL